MDNFTSKQYNILEVLDDVYHISFIINAEDDTYKRIHLHEGSGPLPEMKQFTQMIQYVTANFVNQEFKARYLVSMSLTNIRQMLRYENVKAYGKRSFYVDYRVTKKGLNLWERCTVTALEWNAEGEVSHALCTVQDITKDKEEAIRDSLTGLYNRACGIRLIERLLSDDATQNGYFVLLDIDCFKMVNDINGHQKGDEILHSFAAVLARNFRDGEVACRIGGDEFAVYFPWTKSLIEAEERLEVIIQDIRNQVTDIDNQIRITTSMGMVKAPDYGWNFKELYEHADKALYKAKVDGKNRIAYYTSDLEDMSKISRNLDAPILSYYNEAIYYTDDTVSINYVQNQVISDLLEVNNGVGVLIGTFDSALTIKGISKFALHVLGYSDIETFRQQTHLSLLACMDEKDRAFVMQQLYMHVDRPWIVSTHGYHGQRISVSIMNAISRGNNNQKMWILSVHKNL